MPDATDFMPRGACGDWPLWLKTVYIYSHGAIALVYMAALPLALWLMIKVDRYKVQDPLIAFAYAAFIFTCGAGHAIDGIGSFYWPNYAFFAFWHLLTAVISWWAFYVFTKRILGVLYRKDRQP